ncbi:MAG: DUF6621 family protein [Bacteroidaceae bacterium]
MKNEIKMSETVMLIDAAFLDFASNDLKGHFEWLLNRPLQKIDLVSLVSFFSFEAGLKREGNQIQLIFIYDDESVKLRHCFPDNLKEDLSDLTFISPLGEVDAYSFQPEGLATLEDLYIESLKVIADTKEVKNLVVISFNEMYGDKVEDILKKTNEKNIVQFRMDIIEESKLPYCCKSLAFPLMHALGIKGEELD